MTSRMNFVKKVPGTHILITSTFLAKFCVVVMEIRLLPMVPEVLRTVVDGGKMTYSPGKVSLKEESRNYSRPKFRQLSRDVSGEVFDIPENHKIIFAYESLHGKTTLIGGICFRIADTGVSVPDTVFDSEFYHVIAFLFVKGDFQGQGVGRRLLNKAATFMMNVIKRPIRVQSAEKAVSFFEKMGFVQVQAPFESMCGPRLFRFLYNMEKDVK